MIYVITCNGCKVQYVGKTETAIGPELLQKHFSDIRTKKKGFAIHINECQKATHPFDFEISVLAFIKEPYDSDESKLHLKAEEDKWVYLMGTLHPDGLNEYIPSTDLQNYYSENRKSKVKRGHVKDGTEMGDVPEGADKGDVPEGADAGRAPEGADAGRAPEGADAGDATEGADAGRAPEGADAGDATEGADTVDVPEGADPGDVPEGADAGGAPEGADAGRATEGADAGDATEGADTVDVPEGADTVDVPEGADPGGAPEGADAGGAPEGADAGRATEGADAGCAPEGADVGHVCRKSSCNFCPKRNLTDTVISTYWQHEYVCERAVSCQSHNLIYVITCNGCKVQYVGKTETAIGPELLQKHFSDIRTKKKGFAIHINECQKATDPFDFEISVIAFIKEPYDSDESKLHLKAEEDKWVYLMGTLHPDGLNEYIPSTDLQNYYSENRKNKVKRGHVKDGTDTGDVPEGADTGDVPEGADKGDVPEGADKGDVPEGADAGRAPEGADAGRVCRCNFCSKLNLTGTVVSTHWRREHVCERAVSCQSSNLIYVITCNGCNVQYVGQSKKRIEPDRCHFKEIRYNKGSSLYKHFKECQEVTDPYALDFEISVLAFIKEQPYYSDEAESHRNAEEVKWVYLMGTLHPDGLNKINPSLDLYRYYERYNKRKNKVKRR